MCEVKILLDNAITSYNVSSDLALITLEKIPNNISVISEIFSSLAKENINVDMITHTPSYTGIVTVSFSILSTDLAKSILALAKFRSDIPKLKMDVDANNAKITIYGEGKKNVPEIAGNLFSTLTNDGIDIKLVTTSETGISYLVSGRDELKTIDTIRREFNL